MQAQIIHEEGRTKLGEGRRPGWKGQGSSLASCLDLPAGGGVGQGVRATLLGVLEPGSWTTSGWGTPGEGEGVLLVHGSQPRPAPQVPSDSAAEARSNQIDERDFLLRFLAKSVFPTLAPPW